MKYLYRYNGRPDARSYSIGRNYSKLGNPCIPVCTMTNSANTEHVWNSILLTGLVLNLHTL